jgi:hypothetical protein
MNSNQYDVFNKYASGHMFLGLDPTITCVKYIGGYTSSQAFKQTKFQPILSNSELLQNAQAHRVDGTQINADGR